MAFNDFFKKLIDPETLKTLGETFTNYSKGIVAPTKLQEGDQTSTQGDPGTADVLKTLGDTFTNYNNNLQKATEGDPGAAAARIGAQDLNWYYSKQARMRNEGLYDNPLPTDRTPVQGSAFQNLLSKIMHPSLYPIRRQTPWSNL